ncbi:hypothetical protein CYMTET_54729 [Cymbomonas tetramitiformis]|uniref:Uncharacterized protein n=1 Tax=Cymbomonas tetramitiformis TaxID=36881 RepID=A0AAE0ENG5_9CHLO|nr:hypothetical protein CYMTET_54729 [Cymbomonas tetramitiformis]
MPGVLESGVQVIVVCDGYNITERKRHGRSNGRISADLSRRYEQYISTLQARESRTSSLKILPLSGWQGFCLGLGQAIHRVTTPYVMVLPHDLEFSKGVDLDKMLSLIGDEKNDVNYIGFPGANNSGPRYLERINKVQVQKKLPFRLKSCEIGGVALVPLLMWKDNPHVASVERYKNLVFGENNFQKGDFLEGEFGQRMQAAIREHGLDAHTRFGTYLLWEDSTGIDGTRAQNAYVFHMDGAAYNTLAERLERKWKMPAHDQESLNNAQAYICALCSSKGDESNLQKIIDDVSSKGKFPSHDEVDKPNLDSDHISPRYSHEYTCIWSTSASRLCDACTVS